MWAGSSHCRSCWMDPGSQREASLRMASSQAIVKFSAAPAHGWQSPAGTGESVAVVPASAKASHSQASSSAALGQDPSLDHQHDDKCRTFSQTTVEPATKSQEIETGWGCGPLGGTRAQHSGIPGFHPFSVLNWEHAARILTQEGRARMIRSSRSFLATE